MQNKSRSFTFLISHSNKASIFIHRFEISKKLIQNSSLIAVLILGISFFAIGLSGVFSSSIASGPQLAGAVIEPAAGQLSTTAYAQPNAINYSRPGDIDSPSTGGPASNDTNPLDESSIEKQLQALQVSGDMSRVPAIWAHSGKINNEFGFRRNPFGGRTYEFHAGMDIDGQRGDLVVAPAVGTVTKAGWQGGYGNMVEVDHGNGLISRYGHLSKIEVEVGTTLQRGQLMGFVGSTGRSTGPHLHYELRFNDKPINPRRFLPQEPTEIRRLS